MSEKTYSKFFSERFKPVPLNSMFGKCSFCVFRNAQLFCNKLSPVCTYVSPTDDDFYGTVYWSAKNSGDAYGLLRCCPPFWITDFFGNTPIEQIHKTAGEMVYNALKEQRQK